MRTITTLRDADNMVLAAMAAKYICETAHNIVDTSDTVVISLPGGRSIQDLFQVFPKHCDAIRDKLNQVHFFWTDERIVPPDHNDSNFRIARGLLESLFLPENNIHRFPGEAENTADAIAQYTELLNHISGGNVHIPLLGVGEDGHVASLFPHHPLLNDMKSGFLHVLDSPKPPSERMSISRSHIEQALLPVLFFVGEAKKQAYLNFLDENTEIEDCPAKITQVGTENQECLVVTNIYLD